MSLQSLRPTAQQDLLMCAKRPDQGELRSLEWGVQQCMSCPFAAGES
jgi:hypothetical protein